MGILREEVFLMDKTMELCNLMGRLPRIVHGFFSEKLAGFGISGVVVPYILSLSKNDGIGMLDLSKKVGFDKANTSRVIKEMVDSGLVIQKKDVSDKRLIHLHLTEKGQNAVEVICASLKELSEKLFLDISEDEKEYAHTIIRKILANTISLISQETITDTI